MVAEKNKSISSIGSGNLPDPQWLCKNIYFEKNNSFSSIGSGNLLDQEWLYKKIYISGMKSCRFDVVLWLQNMNPPTILF